jgi:hypothetical protein
MASSGIFVQTTSPVAILVNPPVTIGAEVEGVHLSEIIFSKYSKNSDNFFLKISKINFFFEIF